MLPPGQKARSDFPRFGLPKFTDRFPSNVQDFTITVVLNGSSVADIDLHSARFPRCTVKSDFHCVTTWSYRDAVWGGVKLTDLLAQVLEHQDAKVDGAVFYAQDGNKTSLVLEDLLADNVIVADALDNKPLSIKHGAPLRLIAPNHYGYKNLKYLEKIELFSSMPRIKRGIDAFLDHPRARVHKEERSRWIPRWILRYVYRHLISGTVKDFEQALRRYERNNK